MAVMIQPSEKQQQSEFAKLFQEETTRKPILTEGTVIKGRIVQIDKRFVVVDVGFKSEGQISINEFVDSNGQMTIQAGDEVEVLVEGLNDDEGAIHLSKERADAFKAWDSLVKIQEEGGLVEGLVLSKIKGGLVVDVGVKAFLPGSQLDVRPVRNLDKFLGKKLKFKILKLNKRRGNIVLSRKEAIEKEQSRLKETVLSNIKEGQMLDGLVKNVTDYGIFVDLGGIDGLLHVTDMSWGRVSHPSDMFDIGDSLKVVVLKYDEENQRISLGLKQLQEDPWQGVHGQFPVGSRVKGKVAALTDYGAFIELCPGVEGLVHISEISWDKKLKHPSQALTAGGEVEAIVLDCDVAARRIALGMKQLRQNPWEALESRLSVGAKVQATVRNITDFGLFVDCGVGVDGLIHISDIDWVQNFGHPEELYKKGDTLDAVILHIDREQERFSLGLKQMYRNPWEVIHSRYSIGTEVSGKVVGVNGAGAVVQIDSEDFAGLLPKTQMAKGLKAGDTVQAMIDVTDDEGRKFHLRLKS